MTPISKYTTEVRFICETYAGFSQSQEQPKVNDIIASAAPKIFENFPIFNETYRLPLEIKILKHFYTREIGFETVGLWKLKLNTKLEEIMPYYNQLYESANLKFNPLHNTDLTKDYVKEELHNRDLNDTLNDTAERKSDTITSSTTSAEEHSSGHADKSQTDTINQDRLHMQSDTPQGNIADQKPLFVNFLTSAEKDENQDNNSSSITDDTQTSSDASSQDHAESGFTGSEKRISERGISEKINNNDKYLEHLKGKSPGESYSILIKQFRDIMLNIDMQIIADLEELFFQLW